MKPISVFDTHVRTAQGRYLHFDVLTDTQDSERAKQFALQWLSSIGVQQNDIAQDRCQFCHVEASTPSIAQAIAAKGYFILPLQGCEEI